jgi:N-methylhydantoinase A
VSEGNKARSDRPDEPKLRARKTAQGLKGAGDLPPRIAVDTGGTFTDFVRVDDGAIRVFKLLSTPRRPEDAILKGLGTPEAGQWKEIIHGSTVATNALLERKGARTALVTTRGFESVLVIGRQTRPDLYDIFTTRPDPLVPRKLRIGVRQRISPGGTVETPVDLEEVAAVCDFLKRCRVESVAVSLLFSFEAPDQERAIRSALERLGVPVSLSSEVLPEYREYERTSTTVVNAYLAPVMARYLGRLQERLEGGRTLPGPDTGKLRVMQSNGGAVSARVAMAAPVRTILSGPAGGVVGAFEVARQSGYSRVITFDMGGTSTDVALLDGHISMTHESAIDLLPIAVPMMDIHTVGAGGGSISRLDEGGALAVGPESAGADPGPICYGAGEELTVTDANVLLGRLQPRFFLGGDMDLEPDRIESVIGRLKWTSRWKTPWHLAAGIVDVVNNNMEQAVRLISVERGHDVRDFTLVCFGGAGGLHAATMARGLGIPRVLVPPHPGALSALGLLLADARRDYSQSLLGGGRPSSRKFQSVFAALHKIGFADLKVEGFTRGDIEIADSIDVRYRGQSFELTIPYSKSWEHDFHQAHERRYGYARPQSALEVVTARSRLIGKTARPALKPSRQRVRTRPRADQVRAWSDGRWRRIGLYDRSLLGWGHRFRGPAIVGEYSSTTWVPADFEAEVDRMGNLVLTKV